MREHTEGPWEVFICDDGGEHTGYPLSIIASNEEDKTIVRQGGFYPYSWDCAMSKNEIVANARLISSAPDLLEALESLFNSVDSCIDLTPDVMRKAQSAIDKARGSL